MVSILFSVVKSTMAIRLVRERRLRWVVDVREAMDSV